VAEDFFSSAADWSVAVAADGAKAPSLGLLASLPVAANDARVGAAAFGFGVRIGLAKLEVVGFEVRGPKVAGVRVAAIEVVRLEAADAGAI
jgi:hypothetical protein